MLRLESKNKESLGKAAGGYTQQIIFIATGAKDVITVAPYFAGVVTVVVGAWVWAVGRLNKSYTAKLKEDLNAASSRV